jgi:cell division cycle 14
MGGCLFGLTISDCLAGLDSGMKIGWFNLDTFDLSEYEKHERLENGDMHWIVPGKFIAFAGPSPTPIDAEGYPASTPEDYIDRFHSWGVRRVVRLNKAQYEAERFGKHGIKVYELYFMDGSCPSNSIIDRFLAIAEEEQGPIAVHCKAGLGRTGTLIGLFCMKHFRFPARAWIGWNRIVRPGSVLGPQQQFLCEMEETMFALSPTPSKVEITLTAEEEREDPGEGERLVNQKKHSRVSSTLASSSPPTSLFSKLLWGEK